MHTIKQVSALVGIVVGLFVAFWIPTTLTANRYEEKIEKLDERIEYLENYKAGSEDVLDNLARSIIDTHENYTDLQEILHDTVRATSENMDNPNYSRYNAIIEALTARVDENYANDVEIRADFVLNNDATKLEFGDISTM